MNEGTSRSALIGDLRPIKVGLIHSLSGMMAMSERLLLEAEMLAIDEINTTGGVLGCQIEPVIVDGASNPDTFAQKAQELLSSGVLFLFGCWTSASRKAVKPLVEDADGLLWYPVQYEGLEESGHIVYTGSCPVQQVVPAVEWVLKNIGSRVFLVGSSYVYPRTANNLIRSEVESQGGSILGECYVPQSGMDFAAIIEEIKRLKPDVVFSTVFGESIMAFYRQYHAAGIDVRSIPVMGLCLTEAELQSIADVAAGHYACQNYFQSLNRAENQRFVANIKKRCGEAQVCSAPMASAYAQIYLWKRVVEVAWSFDVTQVRGHVAGCEFVGPTGPIVIQQNHHTSMSAYIGRARSDGQFEIIDSTSAIRPLTWLGVEDSKLPYITAVKDAMAAFPNVQNALAELAADITERKLVEEKLRKSEQLYRTLADSSPDNIFIVRRDTSLQYMNRIGLQHFGLVLEEISGKKASDLFPPEVAKSVAVPISTVFQTGKPVHAENEVSFQGTVSWRDEDWIPLRTGSETTAVLGISRDITERKRSEKASSHLAAIVESSDDGIISTPLDGTIISWNKGAEEMFGYSLQEVVGKPVSLLIPPNQPNELNQILERVKSGERNQHYETKRMRKDGKIIDVAITVSPIKDSTGRIVGGSAITKDITKRKRMEQELEQYSQRLEELVNERTKEVRSARERLEYIITSNPAAIFTGKPRPDLSDFDPTYASKNVFSMFGSDVPSLPGSEDYKWLDKIWKDGIDPEDLRRYFAEMPLVWKDGHHVFEYRFVLKDGTYRWIHEEVKVIRDAAGNPREVIGCWTDLTEWKRMEKMRDEFLADATDELLTPLVSIKGYLDNVLTENNSLPGKVTSDLQVMQRNVDRLHEIVNNLLDIRQMGMGRISLNLEPLDLRQVLENCVAEAKPISSQKHSFHLEIPENHLPISGDRVKLSLVVGSLLNNAVKFTPQGGEIIIRGSEEADMIKVRVSDMGIGIKQENLGRVFEPFPAIQKSDYVKGRGLGLSIAKGLVEAHAGRIWVESEGEGKGATFTFTLPKRKELG